MLASPAAVPIYTEICRLASRIEEMSTSNKRTPGGRAGKRWVHPLATTVFFQEGEGLTKSMTRKKKAPPGLRQPLPHVTQIMILVILIL